jgi:hypothetical protein
MIKEGKKWNYKLLDIFLNAQFLPSTPKNDALWLMGSQITNKKIAIISV